MKLEEPHVLAPDAVAELLEVASATGLTSAQALDRLALNGQNQLPPLAPWSPWLVLLGQFKSILILILIGAALLAASIGSFKDAVVVLAVVVINALVGFYQEYRAGRSLEALKLTLPVRARVRRDGVALEVSAETLESPPCASPCRRQAETMSGDSNQQKWWRVAADRCLRRGAHRSRLSWATCGAAHSLGETPITTIACECRHRIPGSGSWQV